MRKGFPYRFVKYIMKSVEGCHVAVKVNDLIGPYFNLKKGLVTQGEPLAPICFSIAVDVLSSLIKKSQE